VMNSPGGKRVPLPGCRSLFVMSVLFLSSTAYGFAGYTSLSFSGGLYGYSETWRDPLDVGESYCEYVDFGWYYCEGYEFWYVSVDARLYAPTGALAGGGYSIDPQWAKTHFSLGGQLIPGPWTAVGDHHVDVVYQYEYCLPYQGCDSGWQQTTESLGQSAAQIQTPVICTYQQIDQAAISAVMQWPVQEPWERGVMLFCAGSGVSLAYYGDSFGQFYNGTGQTNDPCAVAWALSVPSNLTGLAHAHPWFDNLQEYRGGDNCHKDTAFHTVSEIMHLNTVTNLGPSDGDKALSRSQNVPIYTRSPMGDEVRRYFQWATPNPEGVYP